MQHFQNLIYLIIFAFAVPLRAQECGAFVAPGVWKPFLCYNLGAANTSADPFTPGWEIVGGYWQWGRKTMAAPGPSGPGASLAEDKAVSGWNTTDAPNGSWMNNIKTENDPCPDGYRVPTEAQWRGVISNNTRIPLGTWGGAPTNYSCGVKFGSKLFLPAAGGRSHLNGALVYRGHYGIYWSSTEYGARSWLLHFNDRNAGTDGNERAGAPAVRCIADVSPANNRDCGAYVAPGEWKVFMCYNLGTANPKADPFTPGWEINGGYWQWGIRAMAAAGPSGTQAAQAREKAIAGWNTTNSANGDWSDRVKTTSDPCPEGYRVPTEAQWKGVIANNARTPIGTWEDAATNYSYGMKFGNKLVLPAAGYRRYNDGALLGRGSSGLYWSSKEYSSFSAWHLVFSNSETNMGNLNRTSGHSVRCVAE
ncbi:MAG: hypothetical protein RLZ62_987 [Bacteroidota bacterium]|jgi:uncharacterized protein (TIGR02145 family)